MPNWCKNTLTVTDESENLKEFKCKAKGENTDFSLNSFLPLPKELKNTVSPPEKPDEELIQKYGYSDWFDWCAANWGTKRDIKGELVYETDTNLVYTFNSAWDPPLKAIETISGFFPALKFEIEYEEPRMAFYGKATAENGALVDECYEMRSRHCSECKTDVIVGWEKECPLCGELIE